MLLRVGSARAAGAVGSPTAMLASGVVVSVAPADATNVSTSHASPPLLPPSPLQLQHLQPQHSDLVRVRRDTDTIFATVAGTFYANDAFWREKCKEVPADADYLVLTMTDGDLVDYFKPVVGADWCQMLTSVDKHQYSPDGSVWYTPVYYSQKAYATHSISYGGSAIDWPKNTLAGDQRKYLTMWGKNDAGNYTGACCSNSISEHTVDLDGAARGLFGHPFTFAYRMSGTTASTTTPTTTTTTTTARAEVRATELAAMYQGDATTCYIALLVGKCTVLGTLA